MEQRAAQVVPVVLESPAAQVVLVVSAAPENPAARAGSVVLVVPESPAVQVAQVVSESPVARAEPVVRVVLESPVVQVGPEPEQKLAVAEQENVPAAGPALSRPRNREAAAPTVSAVINPQREEAVAAVAP